MKVAVFGGSFDPPHNGHLWLAKMILRRKFCEKAVLIPANMHPFAKKLSSANHRLAMTKLLENENIKVSDIEIRRGNISYSIDTLNELQKLYPQDDFVWIIGEDQIENFTKWKSWKEIIVKYGLIIVPRTNYAEHETINQWNNSNLLFSQKTNFRNITTIDKHMFQPLKMSSSEIRKKVKEGKKISRLVPKEIEKYIMRHGLYL